MVKFMVSKSFFVSLILTIGLVLQTSQATDKHIIPSDKDEFPVTLFAPSPHHQDNISGLTLEQLIGEARNRKEQFDSLYNYVCKHGLQEKKVHTAFDMAFGKELISFQTQFPFLPRELILLQRLKTDYTIERNLLHFYTQSLYQLNQNELSQITIQKLHHQTVYIVRLNMHSLITATRTFLAQNSNGECFWEGENFGVPYDFQSESEEGQLYQHLALTYRSVNPDEEDSEVISQMMSLLAQNSHKIQDPLVIFNYNSLVFYLKLERFLSMQYDYLVFDPNFYHFDVDISNQSKQFLLSALYKEKTESWIGQIFDPSYMDA